MSWSSTRVQVMKKMLSKQDDSGVYQMYIRMTPIMHTTYEVVAISIAWMWLQFELHKIRADTGEITIKLQVTPFTKNSIVKYARNSLASTCLTESI